MDPEPVIRIVSMTRAARYSEKSGLFYEDKIKVVTRARRPFGRMSFIFRRK